MRVSVVMAVRDGELYVAEAIDSILGQSFTDFEFLIVDDASADATPAILDRYRARDSRIRLLRNETNRGLNPSLNRALVEARGTIIARQDADDVSTPDRFALQLDALDSTPDASLVIGAYEVFPLTVEGASPVNRPSAWQPRLEWDLLFTNAVGAGAHVMYPRIVRGTAVSYPGRRRYAEDYALWCQLVQAGRVACPVPAVYRYRQHRDSITNRNTAQQARCLAEIRHEYQSLYLGSDVSLESVSELSRFWLLDDATVPGSLRHVESMLARLRSGFLTYVEERYGAADRTTLESQLDQELVERLGYWLVRSIRLHDARAVTDVLSIAGDRRRIMVTSRKALRHAGGAAFRKLGRQPRAGRVRRTT